MLIKDPNILYEGSFKNSIHHGFGRRIEIENEDTWEVFEGYFENGIPINGRTVFWG